MVSSLILFHSHTKEVLCQFGGQLKFKEVK